VPTIDLLPSPEGGCVPLTADAGVRTTVLGLATLADSNKDANEAKSGGAGGGKGNIAGAAAPVDVKLVTTPTMFGCSAQGPMFFSNALGGDTWVIGGAMAGKNPGCSPTCEPLLIVVTLKPNPAGTEEEDAEGVGMQNGGGGAAV